MKTTAAVVTYNRKELLLECLDALLKVRGQPAILVIDNASTDGTQKALQPYIEKGLIKYLNTGSNLGGAGGFCFAIREAMKDDPDFVWIMDDDTIVQPDTLMKLLEQAEQHPKGGYFSSKALWTDGSENVMNAHVRAETDRGQKALLCPEATFVSLLLPAASILQMGLPIKEFFIWGDDIEYTRRIHAARPGYYVPGSVGVHKTASNVGSNIALDSMDRLERYRYAYRNEVYTARREGVYRSARQLAKIMYHSVRVLLKSREAKARKIRLIWSASFQGLSFHPRIEYIQKSRQH